MTEILKQRIEAINCGEVPVGYKKTEVGIVPNEWEEAILSEIFTFKNGLNKEKEAFGKGTPIVNYVDVWKKRGIRSHDLQGKVELSKKERENYSANKGDVFFTRTSETKYEIGLTSVMLDDTKDTVFSGFVLRARPYTDKIISEYNQYCYSSDLMRHEVIRKSSITTRALTNGNFLGEVQINLPTKNEQSKIADILMKWDEAVSLQEKLIEKLETQKKALMQRLLMPKDGWKEVDLQDIGDLYQPVTISGSQLFDEGYCVYGANGLIGYYDKYNHEESQVAITCRGSTCGTVIYTHPYSWITGNAMVLNVNKNFNKVFIYYFCCNTSFEKVISGSGQPQITREAIKNMRVIIPNNKKVQTRIANILSKADEYIELQNQKLTKMKEQQKSMMQLLLTGIVRA